MGIGESRARLMTEEAHGRGHVRDVAGIDEAQGRLEEIVDFRRPARKSSESAIEAKARILPTCGAVRLLRASDSLPPPCHSRPPHKHLCGRPKEPNIANRERTTRAPPSCSMAACIGPLAATQSLADDG